MQATAHHLRIPAPTLRSALMCALVAGVLVALALASRNAGVIVYPDLSPTPSMSTLTLPAVASTSVGAQAPTTANGPINQQPQWRSDVMDSHDPVASLAALAKSSADAPTASVESNAAAPNVTSEREAR